MASVYRFKPIFQKMLLPLVRLLAQWGVSANAVTVMALLLATASGFARLWFPHSRLLYGLLPLVLLLRLALNAIDGLLARNWGQTTDLGALLNEVGDCWADVALYLPFAGLPGITPMGVVLVVVFALLSELIGVLGQSLGRPRSYAGPMGKSDRALIFGFVSLVLALGVTPGVWFDLMMLAILILLVCTLVNRGRAALAPLPLATGETILPQDVGS